LSITPDNNTSTSRTEVSYGAENAVKLFLRVVSGANRMIDVCDDYIIPYTPACHKVIKNRVLEVKAKFRYITEVRKDNIPYCKELMKVGQVRHLDGIRSNFVVTDTEYTSSAIMQQVHAHPEIVYSNVRSIVEQQRYFFENLWNKSISAEQKIREIEHGIMPIRTRLLENQEEIIKELSRMNNSSNKLSIYTSIGGMQMSYKYLFDSYKNILAKYNTGESKEGIRYLLNIENKEESINLIKILLNSGIQIRHIKDRPPLSFGVSDKEVAATIEKMEGGKQSENFLISSEPLYVKHFSTIFEELWRNGIDATDRIRDIEEGVDLADIEIIPNPIEGLQRAWNIARAAQVEVLVIFSTPNAFRRQIKEGILELLKEVSEKKLSSPHHPTRNYDILNVRLLVPADKEIESTIAQAKSICPRVNIRTTEEKLQTRITIVLGDRRECIIIELKDDSKDISSAAAGLSTYSNSKSIVSSYISIFESYWNQTELYEQLKVHDKMQKEFINIAAHELRTPIQPILGLADIARSKIKLEDKELGLLLDVIARNAKRLQRLTEDILDVSRIESQNLKLNKQHVDLRIIIMNVFEDYKNEVQNKNNKKKIELRYASTEKDALIVNADKQRLIEVISNHLSNAIKAVEERGEISISVERGNDDVSQHIVVRVRDTGQGIDAEIMPRLFTKFATKSFEGTGLGLYISKSIVEAHGGKIWAENNTDGRGATFTFTLPLSNGLVH
jgi:two-component system, OmpR family, sensor histidine kinase VicK